jgi:hypothetical protein
MKILYCGFERGWGCGNYNDIGKNPSLQDVS